jgi:hypothetical protein
VFTYFTQTVPTAKWLGTIVGFSGRFVLIFFFPMTAAAAAAAAAVVVATATADVRMTGALLC